MSMQSGCNDAFAGPVFLVGMPRSGTKLLRDLLNRHPHIRIPDAETAILPFLVRRWDEFGNLRDEAAFRHFFVDISRHFFFEYLRKRGRPMTEGKWRSHICEYTPAGLFEALVRADTDNPVGGSIIWGDKSPSYIEHIAMIAAQYPEARFIHIVRDVRDYCLSIAKAWGKNMPRAAYRWGKGVLRARNDAELIPGRYLEVRYEQLIESPQTELERICQFLGIEFVPEMLILEKPSENFGDTRGQAQIVATNKGKFLERIDPRTLCTIEEMAYPAMLAYGYAPVQASAYRPPSRLRLLMQRLVDGVNLARAVRREHGLLRGVMLHLLHNRTD